jgi:hypothetical protein
VAVKTDHSKAGTMAQAHNTHRQPGSVKKAPLSKKAVKKLLDKKIAYRPCTLFKETMGIEDNYDKMIYNSPKY